MQNDPDTRTLSRPAPSAAAPGPANPAVAFHVALEVRDLERSLAFYRTLLGQEPAKVRPDYAQFAPSEPPLVLSLNAGSPPGPRGVFHLGIRFPDDGTLDELRARWTAAGLAFEEELDTVCCYARANKLWVRDPDGNPWELYVKLGDEELRDSACQASTPGGSCCP